MYASYFGARHKYSTWGIFTVYIQQCQYLHLFNYISYVQVECCFFALLTPHASYIVDGILLMFGKACKEQKKRFSFQLNDFL